MIHGRVVVVALPALRLGRNVRRFCVASETVVGISIGETLFVLHLHRETNQVSLKMPGLVDGPFRLGLSLLQNKNGLVRPFPAGKKFVISLLRNENIRKEFRARRSRVVIHSQAGR